MDLAAGPDRHWHEHRYERTADRTSTGSTPGTSPRRPGASGRILCGAAAVAAGAGPGRLWLLFGFGPGSGCGRGDHRVPDAASAVAAVRRGRADRRCDRARPPARRGGAARTAGGAAGLAKCRVQPGRRGGGLVGAEAMTGEHGLLAAARDGGQGAFARLVGPYLAQPRACCHRMLSPHPAQVTERWISGPARINSTTAADPSDGLRPLG